MRPARHAPPADHQPAVPAVLPRVIVTIDGAGRALVSVNGTGRSEGSVERDELGTVLTGLAEQAGGPVRVEVREPDGSRYADILQPHAPHTEPGNEHETNEPDERPLPRGEGFLPGETVLVAVVTQTMCADQDGAASLADAPKPPRQANEVVLFGSTSGTIVRASISDRPASRRWRR